MRITELLRNISNVDSSSTVEILKLIFEEILDVKKEIKGLRTILLDQSNHASSEQLTHQRTKKVSADVECMLSANTGNVDSVLENDVKEFVQVVSSEVCKNISSEKDDIKPAIHVTSANDFRREDDIFRQLGSEVVKVEKALSSGSLLNYESHSNTNCTSSVEPVYIAEEFLKLNNQPLLVDEDKSKNREGDAGNNSCVVSEVIQPGVYCSSVLSQTQAYNWKHGHGEVQVPKSEPVMHSPEGCSSWPTAQIQTVLSEETEVKKETEDGMLHGETATSCSEVIKRASPTLPSILQRKTGTVKGIGGLTRQKLDTRGKVHVCSVCSKSFATGASLRFHVFLRHREKTFECRFCKLKFASKDSLTFHHCSHGKMRYVCSVCDKAFSYQKFLKNHARIHTGEKPFICSVCDKAFSQQCHLDTHMLLHTGEKPYNCTTCNKAFSQKRHLKSHMRIHSGERPYICTVCCKAFALKSNLNAHTRTHTGERPHVCSICNKAFLHKRSLKDHALVHTGERPYSCMLCNKAFSRKFILKRHMAIHSDEKPYICAVCNKSFALESALKKHLSIHLDRTRYICAECNKSFALESALKKHMSVHIVKTPSKSFACSVCCKLFVSKCTLKSHTSLHSDEKCICADCRKVYFQLDESEATLDSTSW